MCFIVNVSFEKRRSFINRKLHIIFQKWEVVMPGKVSPLKKVPDSIPRPPYIPVQGGGLFQSNKWKDSGPPSQPEVWCIFITILTVFIDG